MDARVRQFRRRRRSGKCPKDVRTLAVGYVREPRSGRRERQDGGEGA